MQEDGLRFAHDLSGDSELLRKVKTFRAVLRNEKILGSYEMMVKETLERKFRDVKREDVAAAAQGLLEESVVEYVRHSHQAHPRRQIVMAGGVFANVKLNQRICEIPGVEAVFIHPNMGDGGGSYGAAILALKEAHPALNIRPKALNNVYFGPEYSEAQIKEAIDRFEVSCIYVKDIEARVAEEIARKKIVGRFSGRMEYGPRALGNRSILADPTDTTINDWLNKRLKRTEFMPFAPSTLDRAAPAMYRNFSGGAYTSSFMTITFDVVQEWIDRAPAVVHVDGTARPQVVFRENNPSYYRILEEYEKRTGLPLFVNTSFNMHEEPIVCSPEDAIRSYLAGSVDVMAIGNFILEQKKE